MLFCLPYNTGNKSVKRRHEMKDILELALWIIMSFLWAYSAVWVCLISGIIQIVHGIIPEIAAKDIMWGIARILLFVAIVVISWGVLLFGAMIEAYKDRYSWALSHSINKKSSTNKKA